MGKPFKKGHDPRRNTGGRPKSRVREWREALAEVTQDGKELIVHLLEIARDEQAKDSDRIRAVEICLSYLLGKPETTIALDARLDAPSGPLVDARALLALVGPETVARVSAALEAGTVPLVEAGDPDGGDSASPGEPGDPEGPA